MQTEAGNELFSYWLELKRDGTIPQQREFEPARVRHMLPDLFILGKNDAGVMSFRLAGTRLCALFGHELRSRPFTCLWHKSQRRQAGLGIEAMLTRAKPMVTDVSGVGTECNHDYQMMLLPMRSGDSQADRILGAILPRRPRNSALLETISCLYAGESRSIAEEPTDIQPDGQGFTRFMRRLLSIEIVDDGLSGRS